MCDINADSPGKKYSDKFYNISISDKQKILEISKKEKIDGIISYASEVGSTTQAFVGNKLGLPSNPLKSVQTLAYKNKFREFLKKNGFIYPKNKVFSNYTECNNFIKKSATLPVILKPVDASGSKGISKIENLKNLKEIFRYAKKYSKQKKIICEKFEEREGSQIAGDGFVLNGKFIFSHLADQYFNLKPNSLIPTGESWPTSHSKKNLLIVKKTIQRVMNKLKIKFGAFNLDLHFLKKILISSGIKKNIIKKDIFYKKGHRINKFDLGKDSIGNLILNFKTQKEMQKKMNNMDENIKVILY